MTKSNWQNGIQKYEMNETMQRNSKCRNKVEGGGKMYRFQKNCGGS